WPRSLEGSRWARTDPVPSALLLDAVLRALPGAVGMGLSISFSIWTRRAGRRRDGSLAIRPPDAAPRPSFTAYVPAGRAAAMLDLTHQFRAKREASTVLRYAL